jgi:ribosomal protein L11 methyltransferase
MTSEDKAWNLLTIRLAPDAEELAVALLFDLGATGTVTLDETPQALEIAAYFHSDTSPDSIVGELKKRLGQANLMESLQAAKFTRIQDEDWLQKWKEGFEATEIGEKLLIAPSWKIDDLASLGRETSSGALEDQDQRRLPRYHLGRIVIQIDPGMAFGTGTHETTRLCLKAIEQYWKGGRFLDVGTGTGILAMAAALLIPGSEVVAIDVDPAAVEIARQNLAVNNLTRVEVCEAQVSLYSSRDFDMVVANLTATVIIDVLDSLTASVGPSGCLILSGILAGQAADVEQALASKAFAKVERTDAGEWTSLVAWALSVP